MFRKHVSGDPVSMHFSVEVLELLRAEGAFSAQSCSWLCSSMQGLQVSPALQKGPQ